MSTAFKLKMDYDVGRFKPQMPLSYKSHYIELRSYILICSFVIELYKFSINDIWWAWQKPDITRFQYQPHFGAKEHV